MESIQPKASLLSIEIIYGFNIVPALYTRIGLCKKKKKQKSVILICVTLYEYFVLFGIRLKRWETSITFFNAEDEVQNFAQYHLNSFTQAANDDDDDDVVVRLLFIQI